MLPPAKTFHTHFRLKYKALILALFVLFALSLLPFSTSTTPEHPTKDMTGPVKEPTQHCDLPLSRPEILPLLSTMGGDKQLECAANLLPYFFNVKSPFSIQPLIIPSENIISQKLHIKGYESLLISLLRTLNYKIFFSPTQNYIARIEEFKNFLPIKEIIPKIHPPVNSSFISLTPLVRKQSWIYWLSFQRTLLIFLST